MALCEVFGCDLCPKAFDTLGRYNQHLKTHSKPFQCQVCPKGFALRTDLTRHVRARHESGQGRHACTVEGCSFKASRRDNVKQHIRKKHPHISIDPRNCRKAVRRRHSRSPSPSHSLGKPCVLQSEQTFADASTLMSAARLGNRSLLQRLLQLGIDVSAKADDESTALHCAARANQHEMACYLVEAGTSLGLTDKKGRTPLHEAVLGKSRDVFAFLLHRGAQITTHALRDMFDTQQIEMFELTIRHYSNALIDMHGSDMLRFAARCSRTTFMARLLSIPEITPDWIATNGPAVIYRIISTGQTIMLRCLLSSTKLNPNLPVGQYRCLIRLAAAFGQGEITRLLLESDEIDLHLFRDRSFLTLRTAAARGHKEVVEILLEFPDTIVAQHDEERRGRSNALHYACKNGHLEIAKLLLQAFDERKLPVDIQAIGARSQTPLQMAVVHGHVTVTKLLLSRPDVDINVREETWNLSKSPIWEVSVRSGHAGVLAVLLNDARTDPKQVHERRELSLYKAASLSHWSVVEVLLNYTRYSPSSSTQKEEILPRKPSAEAVDVMKRLFLDPKFLQYLADSKSESLWYEAAKFNNVGLANTLFEFVQKQQAPRNPAIDINRYDAFGSTPLHKAVTNNRIDIAKVILQHQDLDINLRTVGSHKPGRSALDIALYERDHGWSLRKGDCSHIVDLLLAQGAQRGQNRDEHHYQTQSPHHGYMQEPAPHANATWASIVGIESDELVNEELNREAEEIMDDTDSVEEDALPIDDYAMFDEWMSFDDDDAHGAHSETSPGQKRNEVPWSGADMSPSFLEGEGAFPQNASDLG